MKKIEKEVEVSRIESGGGSDDPPSPLFRFEVDVYAPDEAEAVLERTREVLLRLLQAPTEPWPSEEEWVEHLPQWFVEASSPEDTSENKNSVNQSEENRSDTKEEPWSVGSFVYWFQPRYREWWWWGAEIIDEDRLRIYLAVIEVQPFRKALDWLLRAAGAQKVIGENLRDIMKKKGENHWK